MAVTLACLVVLGVAAVVMAATNGGGHGGSASPTVPGPTRAARGAAHHRAGREVRQGVDAGAVGAVLRYTPFLAAGTSRHRVIALTFDDGPGPYTPSILRILIRMHVPATFFIVGQQLTTFSAALRSEIAHGFVVGDHTENHAWLIRLAHSAQYAQIHDDGLRVRRVGAPFPRLFRPPYGAFNATTLAILRALHMLMVMWSVDPGDWRRPGTKAIVSNVLENAKPGAVVIMHDGGGDRSQTVAALPAIINGLRRRHFELVTVPRLLAVDPPPRHQRVPRTGAA
jgi:peptidoglycan-N-acetylglucosamine deacetylase